MLYVLPQKVYTEEEAANITGLKLIKYKKSLFEMLSREHDLNTDEFFKKCCLEIDNSDIPVRNVLRDIPTGETHSFDRASGGVMALWLMYHYSDTYMMPTCYFGENCYQIVLDISKEKDIYVYDDSDMLCSSYLSECVGILTDFKTKKVVTCENDEAFDLALDEGY